MFDKSTRQIFEKILGLCCKTAGFLRFRERKYSNGFQHDDEHLLKVKLPVLMLELIQSYDLEIKERGIGLSGGQTNNKFSTVPLHDPKSYCWTSQPVRWTRNGEGCGILSKVSEDKTMLIVTHRNPILTMVNRVFVLENGQRCGPNTRTNWN